ncbi:MAG: hypothetical protein R3C56_38070 [Pirellulaceae bacterium]
MSKTQGRSWKQLITTGDPEWRTSWYEYNYEEQFPRRTFAHYRVITRFDTMENMQRWYGSDERREKVSQLEPLQIQPAEVKHLTGFETWFTPPETIGLVATPPKYKMAMVVWIAVYLTVLPLIATLRPWFSSMPPLVASAILAAISVASMTWIVLPALTWCFRGWLYPKSPPSSQ